MPPPHTHHHHLHHHHHHEPVDLTPPPVRMQAHCRDQRDAGVGDRKTNQLRVEPSCTPPVAGVCGAQPDADPAAADAGTALTAATDAAATEPAASGLAAADAATANATIVLTA